MCIRDRHMTVDEVLNMCNKKSGLLGISGLSSDRRDSGAAADSGHERAIIARDMLIHGIRKYIGSYAAGMNGVDVIVFTAGIGENGAELRERVMSCLLYTSRCVEETGPAWPRTMCWCITAGSRRWWRRSSRRSAPATPARL